MSHSLRVNYKLRHTSDFQTVDDERTKEDRISMTSAAEELAKLLLTWPNVGDDTVQKELPRVVIGFDDAHTLCKLRDPASKSPWLLLRVLCRTISKFPEALPLWVIFASVTQSCVISSSPHRPLLVRPTPSGDTSICLIEIVSP